jgi:hypothetical protein
MRADPLVRPRRDQLAYRKDQETVFNVFADTTKVNECMARKGAEHSRGYDMISHQSFQIL